MHISILQHNSSSDPYSYILESHRKTSIMVTPPLQLARQVPPPPIPKLETIFVVTTISTQIILRQNSLLTSNHLTISKQLRYTLFFIFFSTEKCVRDIDPLFTRQASTKAGVFLLHRKYFCVCCQLHHSRSISLQNTSTSRETLQMPLFKGRFAYCAPLTFAARD